MRFTSSGAHLRSGRVVLRESLHFVPRHSLPPLLLLLVILASFSSAELGHQTASTDASVFRSLGLRVLSDSIVSHSVQWLAHFDEPPALQQLRRLEQELACAFIEIVDGGWLVLAGRNFDTELRHHAAASAARYPRAAAIQQRLVQHLLHRAGVRATGHGSWEGGRGDVHVLRVQSAAAIRMLLFPPPPSPLRSMLRLSPPDCHILMFELDRPGHTSISVTGSWACVLHAVNSALAHPFVISVDLLPRLLLHNRNSSLLLTNAENAASLMNSDLSWLAALGLDGAGEVIGIADSGIDWDHCAFSPDLPLPLNTFNVSKKKIIAYFAAGLPSAADFTRACTQRCGLGDASDDLDGHGTHVAGTAGGAAPSSATYSPFNSMAAASRIVFTDIQVSSDSLTIPDDLYSGIFADAYAAGARIHSNSWGCGRAPEDSVTKCNVYDSMAADIDRFSWEHEDFVVLVAAGNDGTAGAGTVSTPATCKNCITVGSSEGFYENSVSYEYKPPAPYPGPQPSNLAEYSSVGPTVPDGRVKPDVVANGLSVRSAASNGFISSSGNCGHSKKSGTSMATPAVAALVALTRQYFRLVTPSWSSFFFGLADTAPAAPFILPLLFIAAARASWATHQLLCCGLSPK
jgi:subtilisin family serine protease